MEASSVGAPDEDAPTDVSRKQELGAGAAESGADRDHALPVATVITRCLWPP